MRSANLFRIAALALLFALLVFGIHRLFSLRFESGDIYPPYSSLRSDPLGCRALYDTFRLLPQVRTERHYLDLEDISAADSVAVFFLGERSGQFIHTIKNEGDKLLSLAENGARVIIGLRSDPFSSLPEEDGTGDDETEDVEKDSGAPPGETEPEEIHEPLKGDTRAGEYNSNWGIEVGLLGRTEDLQRSASASLRLESGNLPESIPIYSRLYFRSASEGWQTVYEVAGKPVLVERPFGQGTIVIMSDSYLLSNEALRFEFFPGLLSWLMADSEAAVFDESHLGVFENPGIMSLVRKYGLTGFLAALVCLVLLSTWRSLVPLVEKQDASAVSGGPLLSERDQFSGLVNLLRRNIGSDVVLRTCLKEWSRSFGRKRIGTGDNAEKVKTLVEGEILARTKKDDPAEVYNRITALLAERKGR